MRTKKQSVLFILVLLVGMLVNARDADARSYASLDEPIGEGLAVAADAFSRTSTAGDPTLFVTAAAVGNGGGAGLSLLWSNLTSRIGSGMYAAYCVVFCEKHDTNTLMVMNDANTTTHPVMNRNVSETSTSSAQPSTANTQPPSGGSSSTPPSSSHDTSYTVHDTHPAIVYTVLGISESDLAGALASLESRLLPQIRAARESARSNRSRSENNPRPTFLTLADTFSAFNPDAISFTNSEGNALTQSSSFVYQGGKLGVASSTPTETLSVGGSAHLAGYLTLDQTTPPAATTNRLYNSAGDLYWAGNLIGGASTGVWASDGSDVWRAGGKVGIATTSPWKTLSVSGDLALTGGFFDSLGSQGSNGSVLTATGSATKWMATSTLGLAISDTTGTLSVTRGGTGITNTPTFGGLLVGNGTNYTLTATSSLGLPTFSTLSGTYPIQYNGTGLFSLAFGTTTSNTWGGTQTFTNLPSTPLTQGYTLRGSAENTAEATSSLFVAENGNVGVGTANPTARLHIETTSGGAPSSSESSLGLVVGGYNVGAVSGNSTIGVFGQSRGGLLLGGKYTAGEMSNGFIKFLSGNRSLTSENTASVAVIEGIQTTGDAATGGRIRFSTRNPSVGLEYKMILNEYGNLGIGTTSPAFKLSVAGDVYASAYIDDGVTLAAPDYVFDDPDYLHLSLADIEAYIVAHRHLPWLTPRGSGAMSISARINEVLEALENLFLEVFELADWNRRQDEADAIRDQRIDALEAELRAFKAGSDSSQTNPGPAQQGEAGAEPASSSLSYSEGDDAESTEPEQTSPNPSQQAVDAVDALAPTATSEAPEFSEPATLDSGAVAVSASATSF